MALRRLLVRVLRLLVLLPPRLVLLRLLLPVVLTRCLSLAVQLPALVVVPYELLVADKQQRPVQQDCFSGFCALWLGVPDSICTD